MAQMHNFAALLHQAEQMKLRCVMTDWQVAGDSPNGLSVVNKAQNAVNTLKIITALNEISDILKVTPSLSAIAVSTFDIETLAGCRIWCC
jgi:hypothetical protein